MGSARQLARLSGAAALRKTITKDTWTAIRRSARILLNATTLNGAPSDTATISVFVSPDGGTTYTIALRGDTGAPARDIAIDTGDDQIGTGVFPDAVLLMLPTNTTHIYIQETATDGTMVYSIVGV